MKFFGRLGNFFSQFFNFLKLKLPRAIDSESIKPLSLLHSGLKRELFKEFLKNFLTFILCNFVVRTLQYFQRNLKFLLPTKSGKKHHQKLLRKTQIHLIFPNCPELPKKKTAFLSGISFHFLPLVFCQGFSRDSSTQDLYKITY